MTAVPAISIDVNHSSGRAGVGRVWWRVFLGVALAFLLSGVARAGVLDRIEVMPETRGETEIVIWLVSDVVYRSSTPKESGRVVRIYFQSVEAAFGSGGGIREVLNGAAQGAIPRFVVTYPEMDAAMSVAFAGTVNFRVVQSARNRISIFVRQATPEQGSKTP
jgi:hypothetical protein